MGGPQNPGDLGGGQRGLNHALGAGVDDGRGPAGLPDDAGAFQVFHKENLPNKK